MSEPCEKKQVFFDSLAPDRRYWKRRNRSYHRSLAELVRFVIPPGSRVLEIGCGTGELLAASEPAYGVGVDFSSKMIELASRKLTGLKFIQADAHNLNIEEKFDYVIMSDTIGHLEDVQTCLENLHKVTTSGSRILITHYSKLWFPAVSLAEKLRLKSPEGLQNWLSIADIDNLLDLAGFEAVTRGKRFLFPFDIPLIGSLCNRIFANLPLINRLCLIQYVIARPKPEVEPRRGKDCKVSVIVPTLNEAGNIDNLIDRLPQMGISVETIFIDGHSTDGTVDKITEAIAKNPDRDIKFAYQPGRGKADAVFTGFEMATGQVLMILDSDLTVEPEDLTKFYRALIDGTGEFVNGCRLIYPLEKEAMRTLNYLGNCFFSVVFSWLLGQRIKDTLCGTKALFKADYDRLKRSDPLFGTVDPFGDFELLFGAAKLSLKIVEMPVRYHQRYYGQIKIRRFKHGMILLKMCIQGARRIKFI